MTGPATAPPADPDTLDAVACALDTLAARIAALAARVHALAEGRQP